MNSREEVAERLRVYATDFDFGESNPLWYVEKAVFNDIKIRNSGRVFSRLADLIDPTCHMVDTEWDNGECTYGCICKECGSRFEHERARYLNYCSKCGARVLHDEREDN
nr:MAG TPA: DNA-directed RNA polymerase [Caudoviricetes sp.]